MIFKKDQAQKLRDLADKEGLSRNKQEELLTYSSFVGERKFTPVRISLLILGLLIALALIVVLTKYFVDSSVKGYKETVFSLRQRGELLEYQLKNLSSKSALIENDLSANAMRNQQLRGQLKSVEETNADLQKRIISIEKEKVRLSSEVGGAQKKAEELEAAKILMEAEFGRKIASLEAAFNQLQKNNSRENSVPVANFPNEGQVVMVDMDNGFILVNLGSDNNVKVGDIFEIFGEGGIAFQAKAIQVRRDVSACDVDGNFSRVSLGQRVKLR